MESLNCCKFFMAKITKFYFNKASYLVGDHQNEALLVVDYKNNKFGYDGRRKRAVVRIARDLLRRKHGVNFADRVNGH